MNSYAYRYGLAKGALKGILYLLNFNFRKPTLTIKEHVERAIKNLDRLDAEYEKEMENHGCNQS